VTPSKLAELVVLVDEGTISGKQAKEVFAEMAASGEMPGTIVERKGLRQVSDSDAIEAVVRKLLAEHPDEVASYRSGKSGLIGWFVGQVMREMRGQANPAVVNEVLKRHLGS
jgi:aspartyl-tRNA(Asn)/glutamyl-tRNA(Gln) amidotransferase subunit B